MSEYPVSVPASVVPLPIGAIIAYVGPTSANILGTNWQLCNGDPITRGPLKGERTPKLTDERFLIGVATPDAIRVPGGSNSWQASGAHDHPGVTGQARIGGFNDTESLQQGGDKMRLHNHSLDISGSGQHDHGEKRPSFLGVYFIMRVE